MPEDASEGMPLGVVDEDAMEVVNVAEGEDDVPEDSEGVELRVLLGEIVGVGDGVLDFVFEDVDVGEQVAEVEDDGVGEEVGEGEIGEDDIDGVIDGEEPRESVAVGVPVPVGDANCTQAMDTCPAPPSAEGAPPLAATE